MEDPDARPFGLGLPRGGATPSRPVDGAARPGSSSPAGTQALSGSALRAGRASRARAEAQSPSPERPGPVVTWAVDGSSGSKDQEAETSAMPGPQGSLKLLEEALSDSEDEGSAKSKMDSSCSKDQEAGTSTMSAALGLTGYLQLEHIRTCLHSLPSAAAASNSSSMALSTALLSSETESAKSSLKGVSRILLTASGLTSTYFSGLILMKNKYSSVNIPSSSGKLPFSYRSINHMRSSLVSSFSNVYSNIAPNPSRLTCDSASFDNILAISLTVLREDRESALLCFTTFYRI